MSTTTSPKKTKFPRMKIDPNAPSKGPEGEGGESYMEPQLAEITIPKSYTTLDLKVRLPHIMR